MAPEARENGSSAPSPWVPGSPKPPPPDLVRVRTHTYMSTAQRSAKLFSHVMFPSQSFHSALFTPPLLPIEM